MTTLSEPYEECIDCGKGRVIVSVSNRGPIREEWTRNRCLPCYRKFYKSDEFTPSDAIARAVNRPAISEGDTRKNNEGYVLEVRDGVWQPQHRLKMSDWLGRQLVRGENVHHLNGVRDDNRIENLELWASFQPYGQRVSQLLDYVVEVHADELRSRLGLSQPS